MSTTNKTTCPASTTQKKQRLFDSILDNEARQDIDFQCQKHANRVGLLFKVLYNRDLSKIRKSFEDKLSLLLQDVANSIDNELYPPKKD